MTKITEDKIILILEELISYCEKIDKKSMRDVYELIKDDLSEKKISASIAERRYRYFCGYQAHADLSDYEYIRVKKIIHYFLNWSPNGMD